jgi:hypothetical protein
MVTLPGQLFAQSFQGSVTGIVEDAQGAAVPGASVTVRNEKTGESRTQISTSTGTVVFPNLLVGSYTVTVELAGFKKYERSNVSVKSNTSVDVKARLSVGDVTEIITVLGGAELVKTTSSQLEGATFSARQLTDLPVYDPTLNGDVTNFAVLAPGVGTQSGGVVGQGGVIGGNRPRNNSFVVDGLDNNDPSITGAVAVPIQDSVEEFQLLTNQFSAEFGHSTAGQFITTTKSGTNDFHGSVWEYNINRNYNSLDNLTRATASQDPTFEKPRFDRNRSGGSLSGPIFKDKLFFYGAYEYRNLTLGSTAASEILVPTSQGLGTLQALANAPGSGVSPVNVGLLSDFVPTAGTQSDTVFVTDERTGAQVPIGVGAFSGSTPNFSRTHVGQFNMDAQASKDHRLGVRLFYSKQSQIAGAPLPVEVFNTDVTSDTKRGTFSWVWTPRENVINEFRAGYTKQINNFGIGNLTPPGRTDVFSNYALDDIGLEIGPNGNYPQNDERSTVQFANTNTWIKGAHTLKFGGEYRKIINPGHFLPRERAEYRYSSIDEFARDTIPSGLAIRGTGSGDFAADHPAVFGFIQDSWRITPRVTLDIGLRYEWNGTAVDNALQNGNALANVDIRGEVGADGQNIFNSLTPAHQALLLAEFPDGTVTFKKPESDKNNFAPRVGFAWDINGDGKSSLRGGFAIAHDVFFGNLPSLQLPPQLQAEVDVDVSCALSPRPDWCGIPRSAVQFSNVGFLESGGILPTHDPTASEDPVIARLATQAFLPSPETLPETYTWSLSYQREMARNWVAEVRYIGTLGRKLPVQRRKNAGIPNPVQLPIFASQQEALTQNFSGTPTLAQWTAARTRLLGAYGFASNLTSFDPVGKSKYHGGSISITRRFTNGIGFNVNYTLSRTEDNSENELFTSLLNPRRPDDFWDIDSNTGLSALHKPHKFAGNVTWELSQSKSKLLGGWVFNAAVIFESGQALTIQSSRDQNGDFDTTGDRAWFNSNGDPKVGTDSSFVCSVGGQTSISPTGCPSSANVVGYVSNDPNAGFVRGREGAQVGVGLAKSERGAVLGPGNIHVLNVGLYKTIAFGKVNLRLGATCSNCTNTPSFALGTASGINSTDSATGNRPYVIPGSPNFLDETSFSGSLGSSPYQRIIQLEGKISF